MFFITLIVFILLIGVLVLVHELGHYVAARAVGIKVEEFAIGMGPKVWGWVKNGIKYNIRALPIGGFVQMYGEEDYDLKAPNSFAGKKPSRRLIVLIAGVFMNLVLAILLLYAQGLHQDFKYRNIEGIFEEEFTPWFGQKTEPKIAIRELSSSSSPLGGKVSNFDIITRVNGNDYKLKDFSKIIESNQGKEITLDIVGYTSAESRSIKVTPRINEDIPQGEGPLGIKVAVISFTEFTGSEKITAGFAQSANTIENFGYSIGQLVKKAVEKSTIVPVADNVGGAIGIFEILSKIITTFGFWGVIELMALFSINLAVFNILPIPALDGGHVLFTLLEIITRRRLPSKVYNFLTTSGFVLLISFMLFITSLDLIKHTNIRNIFCADGRNTPFVCELSDYR